MRQLNKKFTLAFLVILITTLLVPPNVFAATSTTIPTVTTYDASNVGETTATLNGSLDKNGGESIYEHGLCWGINSGNPENKENLGAANYKGSFSVNIRGLQPDTTYYYYAYAKNINGKSTGYLGSFTTASPPPPAPSTTTPTIRTYDVSNVGETTATLNGNLEKNGGETITDYGFCYGLNQNNPEYVVRLGTTDGKGFFSTDISGLKPETTYYFYAYAKNKNGKDSGYIGSFTTASPQKNVTTAPTVTTDKASNVGKNAGKSEAKVNVIPADSIVPLSPPDKNNNSDNASLTIPGKVGQNSPENSKGKAIVRSGNTSKVKETTKNESSPKTNPAVEERNAEIRQLNNQLIDGELALQNRVDEYHATPSKWGKFKVAVKTIGPYLVAKYNVARYNVAMAGSSYGEGPISPEVHAKGFDAFAGTVTGEAAGGAVFSATTKLGKIGAALKEKVAEPVGNFFSKVKTKVGSWRPFASSKEVAKSKAIVSKGTPSTVKGFEPPKVFTNNKGQITNGKYTIDAKGMEPHTTGSTTSGKSQFLYGVDVEKATLDAAAYADANNLWVGNQAKVPVVDGMVGVTGKTGQLTNYINVYKTNTGFVHASPGNPPK